MVCGVEKCASCEGQQVRPLGNDLLNLSTPTGSARALPRAGFLDIIAVWMIFTLFQIVVSSFSPANIGS